MGREVRMVPKGWEHPYELTDPSNPVSKKKYKPLFYGWKDIVSEFEEMLKQGKSVDYTLRYFGGPSPDDYIDSDWEEDGLKPELYVMYENTSEGTPISPAFNTIEKLARWLADNRASAFGGSTATYKQWLATCKSGWAVSLVMENGVLKSGVEAFAHR